MSPILSFNRKKLRLRSLTIGAGASVIQSMVLLSLTLLRFSNWLLIATVFTILDLITLAVFDGNVKSSSKSKAFLEPEALDLITGKDASPLFRYTC